MFKSLEKPVILLRNSKASPLSLSASLVDFAFLVRTAFFDSKSLKLGILYPIPITKSFERASLICAFVILKVKILVRRTSTRVERLFKKVISTPNKGAKVSLIETVETSKGELGTGSPVETFVTKPQLPIYRLKVEKEE